MKKYVLFLVALVAVVALVGCGNTKKEEVVVETIPEVQEEEVIFEPTEEITMTPDRMYQSDISEAFQDYLKELSAQEGAELADYTIENINVLSEDEKREVVENFSGDYFMTDVLASVIFSVKPADKTSMYWLAGNGEESGDWVVNKNLLVTMRDGKLTNMW